MPAQPSGNQNTAFWQASQPTPPAQDQTALGRLMGRHAIGSLSCHALVIAGKSMHGSVMQADCLLTCKCDMRIKASTSLARTCTAASVEAAQADHLPLPSSLNLTWLTDRLVEAQQWNQRSLQRQGHPASSCNLQKSRPRQDGAHKASE